MLATYLYGGDSDHYAAAIRNGDYLLNSYPMTFSDGDPDFIAFDVLFLEELALITGDTKYSNFVQVNFWNKLAAGNYGEGNDQDAEDWANDIPIYEEYPWKALEPVFLSAVVIAAQYTNEADTRTIFMNVLLEKLEDLSTDDVDGDLHALSGAVMASAHTGIDLNPQSGRWANANSTQDLVNILISYQRSTGDWPYDTSRRASLYVGDVSVTTWACMALKAWQAQTYAARINNGLAFVKGLQQPDGQILTNPGWPATTDTGVQVHGVALVAIATNDGIILNDVVSPTNQAPVAQAGDANTNEDTPIAITLQASDADNDPLTYVIMTSPAKGTLSGTAPLLTYTPLANANGSDSFTFRANDGQTNSNTATFSLTINAVNDAPVASNQDVSTTANTALPITLVANDVDNDALTYNIVTQPAHGTLSGTPPALTYMPAAEYTGGDSFTFSAHDGITASNVATVTITVLAASANVNLALNRPTTASSTNSSNPSARAVDGNTSTYWRSGSVSGSTITWLRVDLQSAQSCNRVLVNWSGSYYAKRYQIQVSQDNVNWTSVYVTEAGNGGIDEVIFAATTARYVRVYMTRNNKSNERIKEFEVYGGATVLGRPCADAAAPDAAGPGALELLQNYPNPFSASGAFGSTVTSVRYRLAQASAIELKVYNMLGQQIALLASGVRAAGEHAAHFDATGLPSGIYFSVLQVGEEKRVMRMQLLK